MSDPDVRSLTVRDVMSDRLVSVSSSCRVEDALDTIIGTRLRHLVVLGPQGRCRGIITSESVAMAVIAHAVPEVHTVGELLPQAFTAVAAHTSVEEAASLMLSAVVDALAVVDGLRRPLGIVTWSDILRAVASGGRPDRLHHVPS
ncbi:MAG TPA: CBS domain-containing protein [Nocardioidaceae bacterium]|nr:CBS domain-containing protein [Nocardioidaceae bacterium]